MLKCIKNIIKKKKNTQKQRENFAKQLKTTLEKTLKRPKVSACGEPLSDDVSAPRRAPGPSNNETYDFLYFWTCPKTLN